MFIVWDLELNVELNNFSLKGDFWYIHGISSNNGYIFTSNSYVNLDYGATNPYFDYDLTFDYKEYEEVVRSGYHINANGKL